MRIKYRNDIQSLRMLKVVMAEDMKTKPTATQMQEILFKL